MNVVTSRKHAYIILTLSDPTLYSKTGVYMGCSLFFLFLIKNIDCGYSLEPHCWDQSHPSSVLTEFFYLKFSVFGGEIFYIRVFEWACFRIDLTQKPPTYFDIRYDSFCLTVMAAVSTVLPSSKN